MKEFETLFGNVTGVINLKTKRIISGILSLCLVFSSAVLSVGAEAKLLGKDASGNEIWGGIYDELLGFDEKGYPIVETVYPDDFSGFSNDEVVIPAETPVNNTEETAIITNSNNTETSESKGFLYGDLNNDNVADLTDLTCLSLYLLKDIEFTDDQIESADIDMSGEVDIADLAYYKQYVCKDESVMSKLRININKTVLVATVKEVHDKSLLVIPAEGTPELQSASLISVNYDPEKEAVSVGDTVEIIYSGFIMESFPAQIHSYGLRKLEKSNSQTDDSENNLNWGWETDAASGKPLPSNRISLSCSPFCSADDTLKVKVGIGAGNASADKDASKVHYTYSVCASEGNKTIDDERLIVNGKPGAFNKEYSKDEWKLINMNGKINDYDKYYNEPAEIDFKNYKPGSSGCIAFSFGESNDDYPTSHDGMGFGVYFYVGEKGTGIGHSNEEAKSAYLQNAFPEYFELSAFKGIEVYVWQMSENTYTCGLMSGTNRNKTEEEIFDLPPLTVDEATAILKEIGVDPEDVFVIPVSNPLSSYYYDIDKEYQEKVQDLICNDLKSQTNTNENKYTVTAVSEFDLKLKSHYAAGETVTFKLPVVTDSYYDVEVRDANVHEYTDASDPDYTYFSFIMPEKNVSIKVKSVDAAMPVHEEAKVVRVSKTGGEWGTKNLMPCDNMDELKKYEACRPVKVCNSAEELSEFVETIKENYETEYGWDGRKSFDEVIKNYDESFFVDHTLIIVGDEESSGSNAVRFLNTEMSQDSKLTVMFTVDVPEEGTDDMANWFIFVELSKTNYRCNARRK